MNFGHKIAVGDIPIFDATNTNNEYAAWTLERPTPPQCTHAHPSTSFHTSHPQANAHDMNGVDRWRGIGVRDDFGTWDVYSR